MWHDENKYAGITDIELNKVGVKQSQQLIVWAKKQNISKIISSDLKRAIATAVPTASALNLSIEIDARYREVNFGKIEGLNPEQFREEFPDTWQTFQKFPAHTYLPEGESGEIASNRAKFGIIDLIQGGNTGDIAIFSHGTLIRIMLCKLLGLEINDYRRIFPTFDNTTTATISIFSANTEEDILGGCSLLRIEKPVF